MRKACQKQLAKDRLALPTLGSILNQLFNMICCPPPFPISCPSLGHFTAEKLLRTLINVIVPLDPHLPPQDHSYRAVTH